MTQKCILVKPIEPSQPAPFTADEAGEMRYRTKPSATTAAKSTPSIPTDTLPTPREVSQKFHKHCKTVVSHSWFTKKSIWRSSLPLNNSPQSVSRSYVHRNPNSSAQGAHRRAQARTGSGCVLFTTLKITKIMRFEIHMWNSHKIASGDRLMILQMCTMYLLDLWELACEVRNEDVTLQQNPH